MIIQDIIFQCLNQKEMINLKTKKEILLKNGWEEMIGYCFDACRADDEQLTYVDKEEVFKQLEKGVQIFYWNESHEDLKDLETAWDYLCDDEMNENETEEQFIERMSRDD